MYEELGYNYDRFVNWESRLDYEMPFIEGQLHDLRTETGENLNILDAACGTGMHAIHLAQKNYRLAGADLSNVMIEKARINAKNADVSIRFETAGFGNLNPTFENDPLFPFDYVLCLGNSLPHILSKKDLNHALLDFASCIKPGRMILIQNRNFNRVLKNKERWMEPQSHISNNNEWIFLRVYDFLENGLINFYIITLFRKNNENWNQQVSETLLYPWLHDELITMLKEAGFGNITCYGSMTGTVFDPDLSDNLVITARLI